MLTRSSRESSGTSFFSKSRAMLVIWVARGVNLSATFLSVFRPVEDTRDGTAAAEVEDEDEDEPPPAPVWSSGLPPARLARSPGERERERERERARRWSILKKGN
jgi:hypothetical protein